MLYVVAMKSAEGNPLLRVDAALKRLCPPLALGCIQGSVTVQGSDPQLLAKLRQRAEQISSDLSSDKISVQPAIAATREAYRSLGKDPSRYRGSAEALLRRIVSGKGLYFINNVVDINNLISLRTLCPLGSYDRDKIGADVVFRSGAAGESYRGIGKDALNLEYLPVFADADGPFGSPTSDSERAMILPSTRRILTVIISFGGADELEKWAQQAIELFREHAAGRDLEYTVVG